MILSLFIACIVHMLAVLALTHAGRATRNGVVRDLCGALGAFCGGAAAICAVGLLLKLGLAALCFFIGGCP